ncbi:MAG TPA: NAD-dependent epimerase/dehydratase family protein [Pyrinomonadaceae bacterium]|nr:NAD-dependent epimerase/dehydratase family protein [Pyrinomonadaceae bacterium]
MNKQGNKTRVALVGCGAIAQLHARALASVADATCTAVYDRDHERAVAFARNFCPAATVLDDLSRIAEHAEAAVVAVPNASHAPVSIELLRAGLDVLCEKPLAVSVAEAREMIETAERAGRVLVCGLLRRFYNSTRLVSEALRRGLTGSPLSFEVRESVWNWPLNRATFDPHISGGGVLIDIGPHVFDLLHVWFGAVEVVEYVDDNRGGVEAHCTARVRCGGADGVEGVIHLTRAYGTLNRTRIRCERGLIDYDPHARDRIRLIFDEGGTAEPFETTAEAEPAEPFVRQLENFLRAVRGEGEAEASARAALASVEAVEACYKARRPLVDAWQPERQSDARLVPEHPYKKILVTGASGAVGSRMVELWAAEGRLAELRCMLRGYRTAARIKRYGVEIVEADLTDAAAVRRAAEGCDAIVHLGVGDAASRETEPLLAAARELGIRRFVHMSTAAVYGISLPASIERLQERTPVVKTGEPYADEKAKAERAVMRECRRGLEGVILRPHMVYGPGLRWSAELMALLPKGEICILEDGAWCNLIYVDDLVAAVARALVAARGFGEPLFVTDGAPLRWSEYIEAHAALAGVEPPRALRSAVLGGKLNWREWIKKSVSPLPAIVRSNEFRRFVFESPAAQATVFRAYLAVRRSRRLQPYVEKLRGSGAAGAASGAQSAASFNELWSLLQVSEARLSAARAEELIGFRARVDFREGLRRSALWFRQFGLLDVDERDAPVGSGEPSAASVSGAR